MNDATNNPLLRDITRRHFFRNCAVGVGSIALASSGLLHDKVGGPSVFPPIPDGVMGLGQVKHEWKESKGANRFRRGMYTFTFRNSLHPALSTFDAPDAISACTRRIRSNTPLQALNLLNDTAWMEFSRALAARTLKDVKAEDDEQRIAYAFELAASREPTADEREVLAKMLVKKREQFAAAPQTADPIVATETPRRVSKPEFAAWTLLARAILNLDGGITRE